MALCLPLIIFQQFFEFLGGTKKHDVLTLPLGRVSRNTSAEASIWAQCAKKHDVSGTPISGGDIKIRDAQTTLIIVRLSVVTSPRERDESAFNLLSIKQQTQNFT